MFVEFLWVLLLGSLLGARVRRRAVEEVGPQLVLRLVQLRRKGLLDAGPVVGLPGRVAGLFIGRGAVQPRGGSRCQGEVSKHSVPPDFCTSSISGVAFGSRDGGLSGTHTVVRTIRGRATSSLIGVCDAKR